MWFLRVFVCQFIFVFCIFPIFINYAYGLPENCAVTLFSSKSEALRFGEIEELCVVSGTSAISAIEKNESQICSCGTDKVYIRREESSGSETAIVKLVGFKYKSIGTTEATVADAAATPENVAPGNSSNEVVSSPPVLTEATEEAKVPAASPPQRFIAPDDSKKPTENPQEIAEKASMEKQAMEKPSAGSEASPPSAESTEEEIMTKASMEKAKEPPAVSEDKENSLKMDSSDAREKMPAMEKMAPKEEVQVVKNVPPKNQPKAMAKPPTPLSGGFEEGVKALQEEDYKKALNIFEVLGEQGDLRAQFKLGLMYIKGHGVSQNYSEGAKWFRKVAEQGDASAQFNLGTMYYLGNGVPQDYSEAAKWYQKAVEQGNGKAQINLGAMYSKGMGVDKDDVQALKWFDIAASNLPPGENRDLAAKNREILQARMTSEEISQAEKLAQEWKPKIKLTK